MLHHFETSYSDHQNVVASVGALKVVMDDCGMIALMSWDNPPSTVLAYEEVGPVLRCLPSAVPLANHPYSAPPHHSAASLYQTPAASGVDTSALAHHQTEGTGGGPCRPRDAGQYTPGVEVGDVAAAAEDVVVDARQSVREY